MFYDYVQIIQRTVWIIERYKVIRKPKDRSNGRVLIYELYKTCVISIRFGVWCKIFLFLLNSKNNIFLVEPFGRRRKLPKGKSFEDKAFKYSVNTWTNTLNSSRKRLEETDRKNACRTWNKPPPVGWGWPG